MAPPPQENKRTIRSALKDFSVLPNLESHQIVSKFTGGVLNYHSFPLIIPTTWNSWSQAFLIVQGIARRAIPYTVNSASFCLCQRTFSIEDVIRQEKGKHNADHFCRFVCFGCLIFDLISFNKELLMFMLLALHKRASNLWILYYLCWKLILLSYSIIFSWSL